MMMAIKATSTKARGLVSSPPGEALGRHLSREPRVHTSDPLTLPAPEGYRGLCHSTGRESPAAPRQLP